MRENRDKALTRQQSSRSRSNSCRKSSRQTRSYTHIYTAILVLTVIICCSFLVFHKSISSASNEPVRRICYTSIEIQPGDSLWSIASEHYTDDWEDIKAYMEEIKEFNGISNNVIYAGNYLSIPYVVEEK